MKPSHRVFVNEFLRSGDHVKAYQKAYPNVSEASARNAANRLLQDPDVSEALTTVYNRVKEEVASDLGERMLDTLELKAMLSRMIRMELVYTREVNTKNGPVMLHQSPGFTQILRAADMLAKMEGWYDLDRNKQEPDMDDLNNLYAEMQQKFEQQQNLEEDEQDDMQEEDHQEDTVEEGMTTEKEKNKIESLQQITTKSFVNNSDTAVCDFTTKPQKMIRIARRNG